MKSEKLSAADIHPDTEQTTTEDGALAIRAKDSK